VAVVVPAFNEARLLPRTLAGLPALVDLVVVVDDASGDDTAGCARQSRPAARVIVHAQNRGVGAAIATGYQAALAESPAVDLVAVMAGDDQMDPGDLPALCDAVIDGRADYAKGNRFFHPELLSRMPLWRLAGGLVLSGATRICTGHAGLWDSQCGYTVISRAALAVLPLEELYPRYGYPNDLLSLLAEGGLRVADVVVRPRYGDEDSGITPAVAWPLGRILGRALGRRLRGALSRAW
jgi:glycosyltransferase involved in cell wall biosynthesis